MSNDLLPSGLATSIPEYPATNVNQGVEPIYAEPVVLTETAKSRPVTSKKNIRLRPNIFSKIIAIIMFLSSFLVTYIGGSILVQGVAMTDYTLKIRVIDIDGEKFLPEASIYLNDTLLGKTDSNGYLEIAKVSGGTIKLVINSDTFLPLETNLSITGANKIFNINAGLYSAGKSILTGKLIVPSSLKHNFSSDILEVNNQKAKISEDGSFLIERLMTGSTTFHYSSEFFVDINSDIEIADGKNNIDISLKPAGDIVGELKSFIREDVVKEAQILIENTKPDQLNISENGSFLISDLEVGKRYKIALRSPGYDSRDYEILIKEGQNSISDFRIVEEGFAIYSKADDNTDTLVLSKLDGMDLAVVDRHEKIIADSIYYDKENNIVYYLSPTPGFGDTFLGPINAVFKLDLTANKLTRITQNNQSIGHIAVSYKGDTVFGVRQTEINNKRATVYTIANMAGENRKTVKTVDGEIKFGGALISDDGNKIYFSQKINNESNYVLFYFNKVTEEIKEVDSKGEITLLAINPDGTRVVYSRKNPTTGLSDLVNYNLSTNQVITIKENHDGSGYKFLSNKNNVLIYFATRNGRSNLFTFDLAQNSEQRLTSLGGKDNVKSFFQQGNWIFYTTEEKLYVLDPNKPVNYKLVSDL